MAFGMLSNGAQPIAIEFGVGSLKALQIASGDDPSLIAAACLDTPEELYLDHGMRLQFQLDNLPKLLKGAGFRGRRAICSIPASQTLVQHMQIPVTQGASISSLIASELQMNMGISPSRVVIRHMAVGEASGGGSKKEFICIAIARDVVLKIIQGLRSCRLETVGVHSEQMALVHAFDSFCRSEEDQTSSLYLDIGLGTTKAVIAHGHDLVFAKTIDVAGLAIDQCVAKQLKCEQSAARPLRLELKSLTPDRGASDVSTARTPEAESAASAGGDSESTVAVMDETTVDDPVSTGSDGVPDRGPVEIGGRPVDLSEPLDALTDEIAMCMRYHARLFPGRGIDRAIFVGGEARHLGLCRHVARTLRLPARVADPLPHLVRSQSKKFKNLDVTKPQPGWTVAYGLTMCPADL